MFDRGKPSAVLQLSSFRLVQTWPEQWLQQRGDGGSRFGEGCGKMPSDEAVWRGGCLWAGRLSRNCWKEQENVWVFHFLKFKGKKKQTKTVGKAVKVLREISQKKQFFFQTFSGRGNCCSQKALSSSFVLKLSLWKYLCYSENLCEPLLGLLGPKCFCLITGRGLNGAVNWPCKTNSTSLCHAVPLGAPDVCISCVLYCAGSAGSACLPCVAVSTVSLLLALMACCCCSCKSTAARNGKRFVNGTVLVLSFK